jgi:acetyl-CoA synthetase
LKLRRVPLFFLQPVEFVLSSSCTFISAAISVELVSYCYFELARVPYVIKSSGYRIGPFEVESAVMTHPAVVECAITGVPDEIRGQVIKATIVLSSEYKSMAGEDLAKEIQDHVKNVTAPYKYPRVVEFVDELPKTISGKIRRVEIRSKDK